MYVVNWLGANGSPGWHAVFELTEAAAQVEHLRNTEGVDGAKIYRLEEVAFELKPYFRVELAAPSVPAEPVAPVQAEATWVEPTWVDAAPTEVEPNTAEASNAAAVLETAGDGDANGASRRGLFGR